MGLDIKALADQVIAFVSQNYILVFLGIVLLVLFTSKGVFARVRLALEKALRENWQLTLLASTGVALSLASGYTTFDGLRNFTSAPLLSVLISFGIQGVMLIVAWLIGESFAVGLNQRTAEGRRVRLVDATVGMALGVALAGIVFYWLLNQFDAVTVTNTGFHADMVRFVDVSVYFGMGLLLVALAAFGFRSGGEISTPYVQSLRLIMKNAVLWVMLLASMTASVFFSFDSHFNAIFPAEARKRAAEIRTTNQIGTAIADIGALAQRRQLEEAEHLFTTDGWRAYETQLAALATAAQGAQADIERYFVQKLEERRRAINQQQERIATSQSGQAGMAVKKVSLTEELSRLKADRPGLAAEYNQHKSELDAKAREIDAKRVEAMAEHRGVEGTLKQGRGPVYRQRMAELGTLQDQYKIKEERTKDANKRVVAAETRIAHIERELSILDGDLAKLKGEAETAEQRIKTVQSGGGEDESARFDPARVLPAFERARAAFRQQPDVERLGGLHQQCTSLLGAIANAPAAKDKVRGIDCDPKQAADAAQRVFALNAGLAAFQASCAGGDKVAQHTTTDTLIAFGRRCLQDSGLTSKDSATVGARLSAIEMNRDDKAHRFVVTWNAFLDGNRLAYLALVLAIGVDALVFMSGLFGAQALRSPLADVPSPKARSAHQLDAIIEAALLPDTFKNARLAVGSMRPREPLDGFTNEVRLVELDPESAARVLEVLNAGATIGAVRQTEARGHYLVRSELHTFLSDVIKRELRIRAAEAERGLDLDRLESRIREALMPETYKTADAVLHHLHPIDEVRGFTSKIFLKEVGREHQRAVRNLLTAGSSLHLVERDRKDDSGYLLHGNLYTTLARIRARELALEEPVRRPAEAGQRGQAFGNGRAQHQSGNGYGNGTRLRASDDALRAQFRTGLLEALGLSRDSLDRVAEPEIAIEAVAAANALRRQARAHHSLNEALKVAESENKRVLEQSQQALAVGCENDARALQLLNEAAGEIGRLMPALMLLPESGLIGKLIGALEEAFTASGLSDDENFLLNRLRKLRGDLDRLQPADVAGWQRITRTVERLNETGPTVASNTIGDGPTRH
jgi:hypothetical protein